MLFAQISAALGPAECELAVKLTLLEMQKEAKKLNFSLNIIDSNDTQYGYSSLIIQLPVDAQTWLTTWLGSIQWVFQSPYRPNHKRKNWFIGIHQFQLTQTSLSDDTIKFQACRASGAGGQHVNTTDSAIHATHLATGISVKVTSERSQHANKRLAKELIAFKIQQLNEQQHAHQKHAHHQQHALIERGNPIRVFRK